MSDGIKKISENVTKPGRAFTLTGREVKDYEGIPIGTLRAIREEKGLEYKANGTMWSKFDGEGLLNYGTITTNLLANKCVTNPKIGDEAVDTRTLATNAVTEIKIKDDAVTELKIKAQNVTTSRIKDFNVTDIKLADDSVLTRAIKNQNVTEDKIADLNVTEIKIANLAVTTQKLGNLSVTTPKLANKSVMFDKIGDEQVYGAKIPDEGIEFRHLRTNAVTTIKIAPGAVTTAKIADKNVTGDKLADKCIGSIHLIDSSVNSTILAHNSVGTEHIKDGAVTKSKLSSDLRDVLDNAVVHDANGHAQVITSMSIGANPKSGYTLSVDGNVMANKIYNAVYMDIAEGYVPGEDLKPGLIVALGEKGKVYKANATDVCVVGVISDQYAACYGATEEELENKSKVAVGLIGKVPVKVKGPIYAGRYVAAGEDGIGYMSENKLGRVGKALQTVQAKSNEINEVLCLIFPS